MPLTDAYDDLPLDQAGFTGGLTPGAARPLSALDRARLGFKQAGAAPDWGWNQHNFESEAYGEIRAALEQRGHKLPSRGFAMFSPKVDDEADFYAIGNHPTRPWLAGGGAKPRFDAFWQAFDQERATDPNFLPAYKDVHDFGTLLDHVHAKRSGILDDVANQAPDGLGLPGLVGGFARGFKDPLSYIPIGGEYSQGLSFGRRLLVSGLKMGAINAGITGATEPLVRRDAAALGVERTAGEFVADLTTSFGTGAALGGGAEAVRLGPSVIREGSLAGGVRRFEADKFGKALNDHLARTDLPPGSPFKSFDATVAQVFSEMVPRDKRTPDEQAALDAVNRDAEVKATSPFVAGPLGDDAHAQWLDMGLNALTSAPPQRGPVKPIARESVGTPEDVAGTRAPAREALKAKLHRAEAPGADDYNAASGAMGPYQFTARTWVSLFKRRYPADTRSFDQVAALRRDPHLNDVLVNDLIAENAAALRHAGFGENAGNLYLAHFLGSDRAIRVLDAAPETAIGKILPDEYFHDNPFLKREWSAARLTQWAYGKMGDARVPETGAAASIQADAAAPSGSPEVDIPTGRYDVDALFAFGGIESDRPVLNPELFGSPEQHAAAQVRFERQRDAAEGFAPVMSRAEAFDPYEHFDALKGYKGTITAEAIGEALGLSPGEVRRVVGSMQALDKNSPYVLTRGRQPKFDDAGNVLKPGTEAGRVIRRPKLPDAGPRSLVEFLAANGGLKDSGGDLRAMDAHLAHKGKPFQRQLIRDDGMALDDAFQAAIDAGYFPEHMAEARTYEQLPDTADFLDAIDAELRGKKRYAIDDQGAVAARQRTAADRRAARSADAAVRVGAHDEELIQHLDGLAMERGAEIDDEMRDHAASLVEDFGFDPGEALDDAMIATSIRDIEDFAASRGEIGYGFDHEGQRFLGDTGFPEIRDGEPVDYGDEPGGGRSAADAGSAAESRAQFAQPEDDPKRGEFGDPAGLTADAQADSLVHDLEMAASGGALRAVLDRKQRLDLRQRWLGEQRHKLGEAKAIDALQAAELADKEPWLDPDFLLRTFEDDPDGSAAILEAIAEHEAMGEARYRLDEDGEPSDLKSILDEIEQAQKAAATMRDCLKPKGGEE